MTNTKCMWCVNCNKNKADITLLLVTERDCLRQLSSDLLLLAMLVFKGSNALWHLRIYGTGLRNRQDGRIRGEEIDRLILRGTTRYLGSGQYMPADIIKESFLKLAWSCQLPDSVHSTDYNQSFIMEVPPQAARRGLSGRLSSSTLFPPSQQCLLDDTHCPSVHQSSPWCVSSQNHPHANCPHRYE